MNMMGHNSGALDIDRLLEKVRLAGEEWADAKAAAEALEESRKPVLGECLLRSDGKTVGEREGRAMNDQTYKSHLNALQNARKRSYRARVHYDLEQTRVELLRTQAATERAMMNLR